MGCSGDSFLPLRTARQPPAFLAEVTQHVRMGERSVVLTHHPKGAIHKVRTPRTEQYDFDRSKE